MAIKENTIARGVRVVLNENFEQKCLGDKYLVEMEDTLFIADGSVYNDSKGKYVHIKGGTLTNSGYAYLDQLDLEFPVPERPISEKKHQHVLKCIEYALLDANNGDEIKIIVQDNKAEIWNGDLYIGRNLYK